MKCHRRRNRGGGHFFAKFDMTVTIKLFLCPIVTNSLKYEYLPQ